MLLAHSLVKQKSPPTNLNPIPSMFECDDLALAVVGHGEHVTFYNIALYGVFGF